MPSDHRQPDFSTQPHAAKITRRRLALVDGEPSVINDLPMVQPQYPPPVRRSQMIHRYRVNDDTDNTPPMINQHPLVVLSNQTDQQRSSSVAPTDSYPFDYRQILGLPPEISSNIQTEMDQFVESIRNRISMDNWQLVLEASIKLVRPTLFKR